MICPYNCRAADAAKQSLTAAILTQKKHDLSTNALIHRSVLDRWIATTTDHTTDNDHERGITRPRTAHIPAA